MVKVNNIFGDKYSGKVGEAGVFASWKGRQYRRSYVKPANPNTPAQQAIRGSFANAVDKWHDFNALQKQSYRPLTSGQVMSGFNLFVSRWQKMTPNERAVYVEPYTGFKQYGIGAKSVEKNVNIVGDQKEYAALDSPIVIGDTGFTVGTGNLEPVAIVDVRRGRIDILADIDGLVTFNYESGGETRSDEVLGNDLKEGDVKYTEKFPITYKSSTIEDDGAVVPAIEVDITGGKAYVTGDDTFTAGGTINYRTYAPVQNVKYELFKAQTQFNTFRGYSDVNGLTQIAQTAEDSTRDGRIEHSEYNAVVKANISAEDSAKDEYIALVAL